MSGTAEFSSPMGVVFDAVGGSIYVADAGNSAVRVLQGGRIRTLDLSGPGGGPAAALVRPSSVAMAGHVGDLYVTEPHRDAIQLLLQATAVLGHSSGGEGDETGKGVLVSVLLRYTFVAAAAVFLVALVASTRVRRWATWREATPSQRRSPRDTQPPKHWIQNQTF